MYNEDTNGSTTSPVTIKITIRLAAGHIRPLPSMCLNAHSIHVVIIFNVEQEEPWGFDLVWPLVGWYGMGCSTAPDD